MSFQYDQYLTQHRSNVKKGFDWIVENLPELLVDGFDYGWQIEFAHDKSKDEPDEYEAYDAYFYGGNRSYAVMQNYQKAWLLHLHRNPHHWQYWILINDDPKEGEIVLEMSYNYIIEMICDWWAFSWQKGKLGEIFDWYNEHCKYMKLHPKTRKIIEDILEKMKTKLDEITLTANELILEHHGVKGQKWGVKNGPPYPIRDDQKVANVRKHDKIGTVNIPKEKLTEYSLNPDKAPDKAKVFKDALGYTLDNYEELLNNIDEHFDADKLEERGDSGYGMRYQQIMQLNGPNGKSANVLTAWIEDGEDIRLTSVYVTKKEASK